MHSTSQLALVFLVGCLVTVPCVLVQARATNLPEPYTPGPSSLSSAVDRIPTGAAENSPMVDNMSMDNSSDGPRKDDETDVQEYTQHRLQARHGRRRRSKCTRRSHRHGCHKKSKAHAKKPKTYVHSAATAVHHAVSLASAGVTRSGEATYYGTGLGACGQTSTDASMIAAASHLLFDNFPGATANPNNNPICGRKVKATYNGSSVVVQIVDRCVACQIFDLDFSPTAFGQIGPMAKGRLHGMTWEFM